MPKDFGIGASVKRREDVRFLTGAGNYTDDIALHGQTYAVFLRSNVARPEAHAFYPALGFERSKTQHVYRKALT